MAAANVPAACCQFEWHAAGLMMQACHTQSCQGQALLHKSKYTDSAWIGASMASTGAPALCGGLKTSVDLSLIIDVRQRHTPQCLCVRCQSKSRNTLLRRCSCSFLPPDKS